MFTLRRTPRFVENAAKFPDAVLEKLEKTLLFLETNPRHKGLKTHKIQRAKGFHGGDVFEAYIDIKYRLTFEYAPGNMILLRNIGSHDAALNRP